MDSSRGPSTLLSDLSRLQGGPELTGIEEEAERDLSGDAGYRMLFEASPLPTWVYDAETLQFLAVNEAAVRH